MRMNVYLKLVIICCWWGLNFAVVLGQIDSEASYYWYVKAKYLYKYKKDYINALKFAKKAVELDRNNKAAINLINELEKKQGLQVCKLNLTRDSKGLSYQWYLNAKYLFEKKMYKKALFAIKNSIKENPFNLEALDLLKKIKKYLPALEKKEEDKLAVVKKLEKKEEFFRFYNLAKFYVTLKEYKKALSAVERSLKLKRDFKPAIELKKQLGLKLNQKAKIQSKAYKEKLKKYSKKYWFDLGKYYYYKKDYINALDCFERAQVAMKDSKELQKYIDKVKLKLYFIMTSEAISLSAEKELPDVVKKVATVSDKVVKKEVSKEEIEKGSRDEKQVQEDLLEFTKEELEGKVEKKEEEISQEEDLEKVFTIEADKDTLDYLSKILFETSESKKPGFDKEYEELEKYLKEKIEDLKPKKTGYNRIFSEFSGKFKWDGVTAVTDKELLESFRKDWQELLREKKKRLKQREKKWEKQKRIRLKKLVNYLLTTATNMAVLGKRKKSLILYKQAFKKAIQLDRNDIEAMYNLLEIYKKQHKFEHASLVGIALYKAFNLMSAEKRKKYKRIEKALDCYIKMVIIQTGITGYNNRPKSWTDYHTMSPGDFSLDLLIKKKFLPLPPVNGIKLKFDIINGTSYSIKYNLVSYKCKARGEYYIDSTGVLKCTKHGLSPFYIRSESSNVRDIKSNYSWSRK